MYFSEKRVQEKALLPEIVSRDLAVYSYSCFPKIVFRIRLSIYLSKCYMFYVFFYISPDFYSPYIVLYWIKTREGLWYYVSLLLNRAEKFGKYCLICNGKSNASMYMVNNVYYYFFYFFFS